MADRTAELQLLVTAKNLADGAMNAVSGTIEGVGKTAGKISGALEGMGRSAAVGLGMVAETLLQGGGVGEAAVQLGIFMASELTENFGEQAISKLTSSGLLAMITAPLAAVGSTMGSIVAAAIPIGMALLPFIIIGAIVAAIAILILNEDIRNKVFGFVGGLLEWIGKALGGLGRVFGDAISAAWTFISKTVPEFGAKIVGGIIDGLVSLPGRIAAAIAAAFRALDITIGPFHITGHGITIELPKITTQDNVNYHLTGQVPGHASGGWVGMNGPEIGVLGENGPEFVVPNGSLGLLGGGQGGDVYLDGEKVGRVLFPDISRRLFYELRASAPTQGAV